VARGHALRQERPSPIPCNKSAALVPVVTQADGAVRVPGERAAVSYRDGDAGDSPRTSGEAGRSISGAVGGPTSWEDPGSHVPRQLKSWFCSQRDVPHAI